MENTFRYATFVGTFLLTVWNAAGIFRQYKTARIIKRRLHSTAVGVGEHIGPPTAVIQNLTQFCI